MVVVVEVVLVVRTTTTTTTATQHTVTICGLATSSQLRGGPIYTRILYYINHVAA